MTWKPGFSFWKKSDTVNIILIQRYMWEACEWDFCNNWLPFLSTYIGNYEKVKCLSTKCSLENYPSMSAPCIAFNEHEKWSATEKWSIITIQKNTSFELVHNGIYWSRELDKEVYRSLSISTFISTILRPNGTLNSPPRTSMPYIKYVPLNSTQSWRIPVFDFEGDIVRCRWASKTKQDECGDVCGPQPNAQLNETNCFLTYHAIGNKPVVIALKIEDFISTSSNTCLSGTSLQFIIRVYTDNHRCVDPPRYLNSSRNDSIVNSSVCETITEQVNFIEGCTGVKIIDIEIEKPTDMMIKHHKNNHLYTIDITWTPTSDDIGGHFVCFRPIDKNKQYGDLECLQYLIINNNINTNVSESMENYINGSMIPTGLVNSTQNQWMFRYNGDMSWSNRSDTFIRFYIKSTQREIYQISVQKNHTALKKSDALFTFSTKINWTEGEEYYIHLDKGILTDGQTCGRLSPAIVDSSFWTFQVWSKNNKTKESSLFFLPVCEVGSACDVFNKYCSQHNPCQNNGTCRNRNTHLYRYSCDCTLNFSGINCEIDNRPCHPNPCLNFGTCHPTVDEAYDCFCQSPWKGRRCEQRINYCHNITCQNRGVCRSLSVNWTCQCLGDHFYGHYCEFTKTKIIIYKIVSKTFTYVGIISMAVVVIFIIVMDILKYGFGIDPVHEEREKLRRENRAKRRHFLLRQYRYVNRNNERHVSAASFSVAVKTI
ncbi:hypothetical protein I4U23_017218 [Adineta vaga]|nr:hypothetical protein I4U23_017218 [Adineta vaga]